MAHPKQFVLAQDRNVRVLSPIEMSMYRREAVCREELCVCPDTRRDVEAWFKLPVCRQTVRNATWLPAQDRNERLGLVIATWSYSDLRGVILAASSSAL